MPTTVENLEVLVSLNIKQFLADLDRIEKISLKSIREVEAQFKTNRITPQVNDKALVQLNAHLAEKVKDLKQVIAFFRNNPIVVKTITSDTSGGALSPTSVLDDPQLVEKGRIRSTKPTPASVSQSDVKQVSVTNFPDQEKSLSNFSSKLEGNLKKASKSQVDISSITDILNNPQIDFSEITEAISGKKIDFTDVISAISGKKIELPDITKKLEIKDINFSELVNAINSQESNKQLPILQSIDANSLVIAELLGSEKKEPEKTDKSLEEQIIVQLKTAQDTLGRTLLNKAIGAVTSFIGAKLFAKASPQGKALIDSAITLREILLTINSIDSKIIKESKNITPTQKQDANLADISKIKTVTLEVQTIKTATPIVANELKITQPIKAKVTPDGEDVKSSKITTAAAGKQKPPVNPQSLDITLKNVIKNNLDAEAVLKGINEDLQKRVKSIGEAVKQLKTIRNFSKSAVIEQQSLIAKQGKELQQEIKTALTQIKPAERLRSPLSGTLGRLNRALNQSVKIKNDILKEEVADLDNTVISELNEIKKVFLTNLKAAKNKQFGQTNRVKATQAIITNVEDARKAIDDLVNSLGKNTNKPIKNAVKSTKSQITKSLNQANLIREELLSEGVDISAFVNQGIDKGVQKRIQQLKDTSKLIADILVKTTKKNLGIDSPSKIFFEIGKNIISGLIMGIKQLIPSLIQTIKSISQLIVKVPQKAQDVSSKVEVPSEPQTSKATQASTTASSTKRAAKVGKTIQEIKDIEKALDPKVVKLQIETKKIAALATKLKGLEKLSQQKANQQINEILKTAPAIEKELRAELNKLPKEQRFGSEVARQLAVLSKSIKKAQEAEKLLTKKVVKGVTDNPIEALDNLKDIFKQKGALLRRGNLTPQEQVLVAQEIITSAQDARSAIKQLLDSIGKNASQPLKNAAKAARGQITRGVTQASKVQSSFESAGVKIGQFTGEAIPTGVQEEISNLRQSGKLIADTLIKSAKQELEISSPSKVFFRIGLNIVKSIAAGIKAAIPELLAAIDTITNLIVKTPVKPPSTASSKSTEQPSPQAAKASASIDKIKQTIDPKVVNFDIETKKIAAMAKKLKGLQDLSQQRVETQIAEILKVAPQLEKELRAELNKLPRQDRLSSPFSRQLGSLSKSLKQVEKAKKELAKKFIFEATDNPIEALNKLKSIFQKKGALLRRGDLTPQEQTLVAQEIISSAQEARKAIKALITSVGKDASQPLKNAAKAARGQITRSVTQANKVQTNLDAAGVKIGKFTGEAIPTGIEQELGALKASGKLIAMSLINSTKKELGITSPSKVFIKIGLDTIKGWVLGIKKGLPQLLTAGIASTIRLKEAVKGQVANLSNIIQTSISTGTQTVRSFQQGVQNIGETARQAVRVVNNTSQRVVQSTSNIGQALKDLFVNPNNLPLTQRLRGLGQALGNIGQDFKAIISGFIGVQLLRTVTNLSRALFAAGVNANKLETRLIALGKSADQIQKLKDFTIDTGINFRQTASEFAVFSSAIAGSNLESIGDDLFTGLSKGVIAVGANAQQQERIFRAFTQIIGKGKVSSEELRQQLGESLPQALGIAARALNLTKRELIALVESGNLFSDDFVPQFIRQFEIETASQLKTSLGSVASAIGTIQSSIQVLAQDLGKSVIEGVAPIISLIAQGLGALAKNSEILIGLLKTAAVGGFLLLAKAGLRVIVRLLGLRRILDLFNKDLVVTSVRSKAAGAGIKSFGNAAAVAGKGIKALALSLGPILLLTAAIGTAFKFLNAGSQQVKSSIETVSDSLNQAKADFEAVDNAVATPKDVKFTINGKPFEDGFRLLGLAILDLLNITKIFTGGFGLKETFGRIQEIINNFGNAFKGLDASKDIENITKSLDKANQSTQLFAKRFNKDFLETTKKDLEVVRRQIESLKLDKLLAQRRGDLDAVSDITEQIKALQNEEQELINTRFAGIKQLQIINDQLKQQKATLEAQRPFVKNTAALRKLNEDIKFLDSLIKQNEQTLEGYRSTIANVDDSYASLGFTLQNIKQGLSDVTFQLNLQSKAAINNIKQQRLLGQIQSQARLKRATEDVQQTRLEREIKPVQESIQQIRQELNRISPEDQEAIIKILGKSGGRLLDIVDQISPAGIDLAAQSFKGQDKIRGGLQRGLDGLKQLLELRQKEQEIRGGIIDIDLTQQEESRQRAINAAKARENLNQQLQNLERNRSDQLRDFQERASEINKRYNSLLDDVKDKVKEAGKTLEDLSKELQVTDFKSALRNALTPGVNSLAKQLGELVLSAVEEIENIRSQVAGSAQQRLEESQKLQEEFFENQNDLLKEQRDLQKERVETEREYNKDLESIRREARIAQAEELQQDLPAEFFEPNKGQNLSFDELTVVKPKMQLNEIQAGLGAPLDVNVMDMPMMNMAPVEVNLPTSKFQKAFGDLIERFGEGATTPESKAALQARQGQQGLITNSAAFQELERLNQEITQIEETLAAGKIDEVVDKNVEKLIQFGRENAKALKQNKLQVQQQVDSYKILLINAKGFQTQQESISIALNQVGKNFEQQRRSLIEQSQKFGDLIKDSTSSVITIIKETANAAPEIRAEAERQIKILQSQTKEYKEQKKVVDDTLASINAQKTEALRLAEIRERERAALESEKFLQDQDRAFFDARAPFANPFAQGQTQVQIADINLQLKEQLMLLDEQQQKFGISAEKAGMLRERLQEIAQLKINAAVIEGSIVLKGLSQGLTDVILDAKSATEALQGFIKTLLEAVAKWAAQRILGGVIGLFGGSGIGIFRDGGEVGQFRGGGAVEVNNFARTGRVAALASNSNPSVGLQAAALGIGIQRAMKAEGRGAVPIVAHRGEQVLSDRNGDAQLFRALMRNGSWRALKQEIPNFAEGGAVGTVPNSTSLNPQILTGPRQLSETRPMVMQNITIQANDPNAFRATQTQIMEESRRESERAFNRNT